MAGLTTKKIVKKQKKHGNKSGRKTSVRPSQKKAVKNGRHQEVDGPKKTARIAKAVKAIPAGLDGKILDAELDAHEDLSDDYEFPAEEAHEDVFGDLEYDFYEDEADAELEDESLIFWI